MSIGKSVSFNMRLKADIENVAKVSFNGRKTHVNKLLEKYKLDRLVSVFAHAIVQI